MISLGVKRSNTTAGTNCLKTGVVGTLTIAVAVR